jgi:D-cysteine desulfhydrase
VDRPLLRLGFPAARLPHLPLGRAPTPVTAWREDVWVKHEGTFGPRGGGNKVRKLEWTLADALARGRRRVVTVGALGTNHGLATAVYGRQAGLDVALALADQPLDAHVRAQLARLEASGAEIHRTGGRVRTALELARLTARRRRPYVLPVGGSSPLGCLGYVEMALELAAQVREGALPEPARILLAVGSGGTAAGLLAGLPLAGLRAEVTGIAVYGKRTPSARRIARLARRTLALLRDRGVDAPTALAPFVLRTEWLGAGYGHRTPEGEAAARVARESAGLELEPVYTAKAFAALLALERPGPTLFLHTYGPAD